MASAYTTKRGKNKKAKLGIRKDNLNNQANKLNQQIFGAADLHDFLPKFDKNKVMAVGSSEQRRKDAVKQAEMKLAMSTASKVNDGEQDDAESKSESSTTTSAAPAPAPAAPAAAAPMILPVATPGCSNPECTQKDVVKKDLLLCGGCKVSRYCSSDCQKSHWKTHKAGCKALQAIVQGMSKVSV